MKVIDAIAKITYLKPSRFERPSFIDWLGQVEHMVKKDIIDNYDGDNTPFPGFDNDDISTLNKELYMPAPYDLAYLYYLEAQIHYYNEDIDMYNSAMTMFNTVFNQYKEYYGRTHSSKVTGRFRF